MDKPVRNRGSTLVQEEAKSKAEDAVREIEEEKLVQEEEAGNENIEEDLIIKCGLDEVVKCFFKDYVIVWHDPNVGSEENKQYITQLEKFCEVHTFTEWKKATLCIQATKVYCHVITSGTNGEFFVRDICSNQSVLKIYIFCENMDYHLTWTNSYQKVSCVENQIQNVLDQIKQNLLKWYREESSLKINLPAFAPIFNDWDKSGMNNLHRYLKVIPNFKNRSQAKNDILALSRAIYLDKTNKSLMLDFEQNYARYNKETILKWYTKESFLFKVTNNCLRIASSDSIQYCRLVLKDLERAIKNQYKQKSKHFHGLLYRGASLSDKEWSNLKANLHREIEMHGFLSVSKDRDQALKFIRIDESKNVFITILVPKGPNNEEQGFAEVEEFSRFPHEKEIIFNVRSRFTVLETEDKYSEDLPYRHLVLLYGAQGFRKYMAERNPLQGILAPTIENISCSICQEIISHHLFFMPITEKVQSSLCKKCISIFFEEGNRTPLFCIPKGKLNTKIKLKGILTTYPMKLEVPMYGYQCSRCQVKKKKMYYKCVECNSQTKKVWCDDCIEGFSECIQTGHHLILESDPFSFWCNKMSQKELDHFKFQNEILEDPNLFQQGEMYFESHEYQKAIQYYKAYLERDKDNKNYMTLVRAYKNLARVYASQADANRAFEYYSKALEIVKLIYGDSHLYIAGCSNRLGQVKEDQAEYQEAAEYYSKALETSKLFCGDNHPEVATSYSKMGSFYESQAEYQKALEYHSKALEIRESFYSNNHPEVATSLSNIGDVFKSRGEYKKALEYYFQALEIDKSFFGDNHPEVATSLNRMGNVFCSQAENEKALELYSKALEIYKSFYRNNHPNFATCHNNMGNVYSNQAEYQKALEHHSQALKIFRFFYGNNHPEVAISLSNIGNTHYHQGEYEESLECHSQAQNIFKSLYGSNHPNIATSLSNLGNVYDRQGEYEKALELYSRALEIYKSLYGNVHSNVAACYTNIGNVYSNQAESQKALEYYYRALEIRKLFDNNHSDLAKAYYNLGVVYNRQADYRKSLGFFEKALTLYEFFLKKTHPKIAQVRSCIGKTHSSFGDQSTALKKPR